MTTTSQSHPCLVAGMGSPYGDDQAGWLVADQLRKKESFHFDVRRLSAPVELLDVIEGLEYLVCLDAIQGEESPGAIQRQLWPFETSWKKCNHNTHGMDLVTVLKVAESVGLLPAKVVLWTIEGTNWKPGAEMSFSVKNQLAQLESGVEQELSFSRTMLMKE